MITLADADAVVKSLNPPFDLDLLQVFDKYIHVGVLASVGDYTAYSGATDSSILFTIIQFRLM